MLDADRHLDPAETPAVRAMTSRLAQVRGVDAVVIGGSRAAGTHHPGSDLDVGIYYSDHLDLDHLRGILADAADTNANSPAPELAPPGGWGPWVDGGAWLHVDGLPVDWVLRSTRRVVDQCERAIAGTFAFHPQPGHPLGFLDVAYAGEVAICVPIRDDHGIIADLKSRLAPYPPLLRDAMISSLWNPQFLVEIAAKGVPKRDVAYVAQCLSSAAMLCAHAWHAAAGSWAVNEKNLVPSVATLPIDTHGFAERIAAAMAALGSTEAELTASVALVADAVATTVRVLTGADPARVLHRD